MKLTQRDRRRQQLRYEAQLSRFEATLARKVAKEKNRIVRELAQAIEGGAAFIDNMVRDHAANMEGILAEHYRVMMPFFARDQIVTFGLIWLQIG